MKDFYNYVNKNWLDKTIIDEDKFKISTFNIIENNNNIQIYNIIMNDNKLKTFYNSYINKNNDNKLFYDLLNIIDDITNLNNFIYVLSFFHLINCNIFWYCYVYDDLFLSKNKILYMCQSDLCLYDISLYKNNDILKKYKEYIDKMFLIVYKDENMIKNYSDIIIDFEIKLASIMNTKENLRDIEFNNFKLKFKDFNKNYMNNINLILYIKMMMFIMDNNLNINNFNNIIIENDKNHNYFGKLNDLLKITDINILKLYLKWKYINNYLPDINNEANTLYFNLYHKLLKGQQKQKSLIKLSINKCKLYFGDLIGKYFGENNLNNQIINYINEMITNIIQSCNDKFKNIKWMKNETKTNAIIKLNNIKLQIGYNNYIKNYDDLFINDNLFMNLINIELFLSKDNLMKINNNTNDYNEWLMNAYEVNASYNPSKNIITIPCGILQKDVLKYEIDKDNKYLFDDDYNYGTIGTIIGHEIIHAFDDQGRLYDKDGNYNNWWLKTDNDEYNLIVEKMVKMYNSEGINGKLTIGENIADIGGVNISLNALKNKNKNLSKTNLDIFFKSYACLWKTKLTDEYIKMVKLTDYHSLPWIRVNTTLKNIDEFYEVYNVENGYEKKDRINIFN